MKKLHQIQVAAPGQTNGRKIGRWLVTWMMAVLIICAAATTGHAGVGAQGMGMQGMGMQGMGMQGTTIVMASGERLTGVMLSVPRDERLLVQIHGFRGNMVLGSMRDARTGVWRDVSVGPEQLVGLHWSERVCTGGSCIAVTYRIVGAERDTTENTMNRYPDNSDVWLHRIEYTTAPDPAVAVWTDLCGAGGVFVDGRWRADGSYDPRGYTVSCPGGVIAKCIRTWGYKPWQTVETGSGLAVDLGPLHRACIRAARADYCGDGVSHTRDGTLVDMFDVYQLNTRTENSGLEPEAAFNSDGATWLVKLRWPEHPSRPMTGVDRVCGGTRNHRDDGAGLIHVWSNTALTQ